MVNLMNSILSIPAKLYKNKLLSLFLLVLALAAFVFVKIINERWAMYPYAVSNDYNYHLHAADSLTVNIQEGLLKLPTEIDENQAVFLKVRVKPTFVGKFFEPSIAVSSGQEVLTQHFEHGAEGIRYFNLSSFAQAGKREVFLRGKRITIEEDSAVLFYFKQLKLENSKILVVSPHPGNSEMAAYGLYSKYPDSTFVVTVVAGEGGAYKYDEWYADSIAHFKRKGEIRTWNSITLPLLGGVSADHALNFCFFDNTLSEMYRNKEKVVPSTTLGNTNMAPFRKYNLSFLKDSLMGQSDWHSLVVNFKMVLQKVKPDVIVTPHPLLELKSDQQLSTIALMQAVKDLNITEGHFFFYFNQYFLNEFVPYGKSGGMVSLPPLFVRKIYLDGLHSERLNENRQAEKALAIEAISDLRPDTEWRFWKPTFSHFLHITRVALVGYDNTYYKRSVRSNELFFVLDIDHIYDKERWMTILGDYTLE